MKKTKNKWLKSSILSITNSVVIATLCNILFYSSSLGQGKSGIDSLTNLLANHPKEDTVKLNLLVELSKQYIGVDSENGLKLGKTALSLSEQLNEQKHIALAHYAIAQNNDNVNQFDSALDHYQKAADIFKTLNMEQILAYCYAKMSSLHKTKGNHEEALNLVVKAKEINEKKNNLMHLGNNLDDLGSIYNDLGQLDQAMDFMEQSLVIRKELNDTLKISQNMLGIAMVMINTGKYDKAMEYSYEALASFRLLQDTLSMAESVYFIGKIKVYNNKFAEALEDMNEAKFLFESAGNKTMIPYTLIAIGVCLVRLEDYEGAIINYKEALAIAQEFNFTSDVAWIYANLGQCYGEMEQYEEAVYYMDKALKLQEELNSPTGIFNSLIGISYLYLSMEEYDQVILYSERALSLIEDENRYLDLANTHRIAYQAYREKGNYRKAFEHLFDFKVAEDSLFTVKKSAEITNLTSVHDLKEKESENEVLRLNQELDEATIQRQNYLIIGAVLIIFILIVLAFIVYRGSVQRRKMSTHLSELNGQLNQSNEKLKTLNDYRTRLFANINHDFRTPLTLIKGYTDQISTNKDNYLTQSSESDLKNLQKNTSILTQMTSEIQNLLLLEEGKLELTWSQFHLLPMLKLIINMFDSRVVQQNKNLLLDAHIQEDLTFHADKLYFKKIMFNLISNAIRHTSSGDSITVSSLVRDNQVILKVSDTGEGIDAPNLPFIFDRFYQAPQQSYASKEGFGIGLSLVKELVSLHGGQITVESKKGEGTTFRLSMPFNYDKVTINKGHDLEEQQFISEPNYSEPVLSSYVPSQKEKTVLIVDDHEEIRAYIGSILNEDYNLAFAGNGKQALKLLLSVNKIDLIITDLMMPWLDGFELIEQLSNNEQLKNIPVVVVSARTAEVDKQIILKAGVNDFITKPFEADDLRKRVNNRINDTENIKSNAWQIIANNKDLTSNLEQSIIKKIHQLIIDRIDDPNLTVEDVASEINASRSKTFRLIKELTQKTPKAYIKDIRLDYVHELIIKGKIKNASEGARAVGMLNATEFKNQYQAKFGLFSFES